MNVHPTKLEVRFQDSGRLYSQLLSTLRAKFLTTDLNARIQSGGEPTEDAAAAPRRRPYRPTAAATGRLGQGQDGLVGAGIGRRWAGAEDLSRRLTAAGGFGSPGPLQLQPLGPGSTAALGCAAPHIRGRDVPQHYIRAGCAATDAADGGSAAGVGPASPQPLPRHRDRRGRDDHRPARPARADPLRALATAGDGRQRSRRRTCWCPSRSISARPRRPPRWSTASCWPNWA